ncbi:hypothetical protein DACRYDRAFT_23241 [Dacryopinax primogenitus]|uniref:Protein kinase domain-containing protein n=1 Tax=Dacryopinax primogenitus (strain DJM 731) TaxID=1858805 RepID=M5G948_DACPD|nr:uncharacterized protein DACRYDRAFT_23241 [Dacryopinax primogenitus]EJU00313.1 hypothetical protein DACRYDRAFT_23241 [Dacryopinax primogenitus]
MTQRLQESWQSPPSIDELRLLQCKDAQNVWVTHVQPFLKGYQIFKLFEPRSETFRPTIREMRSDDTVGYKLKKEHEIQTQTVTSLGRPAERRDGSNTWVFLRLSTIGSPKDDGHHLAILSRIKQNAGHFARSAVVPDEILTLGEGAHQFSIAVFPYLSPLPHLEGLKDVRELMHVSIQLVDAIAVLHTFRIAHGDINLSNFLVNTVGPTPFKPGWQSTFPFQVLIIDFETGVL